MKESILPSIRPSILLSKIRKLFILCSPIIVISLCMCIFLAMNSLRFITEETGRVLNQNFYNASSEVEWELSNASNINYKLSINRDLVNYLSVANRDHYQEYNIRQILANIANVGSVNISESMIYMSEYDYVLTPEWGAERLIHYTAEEAQTLLQRITETDSNQHFNLKVFLENENDVSPHLMFVRPISAGKGKNYVVTTINTQDLLRKIRDILWRDTDHLIAYNGQGVLFSTMDDNTTQSVYQAIISKTNVQVVDGVTYDISYKEAGLMGIKFAYISSPFSAVALVRSNSITTILLIVFAMLTLIVYVFWLNYKPLKRTLKKLDIEPVDGDSEFTAIEGTVQQYIARTNELNRQVAQSELQLRRLYLEKLLEGRITHLESIRESLSLYNIVFPYPKLMVTLFQSPENAMFISGNQNENQTLAQILMNSLQQKQIDVTVFNLQINDSWVFVFNGAEKELITLGESLLRQVCQVAQEWMHCEYNCINSSLYDEPEKLPEAYREVLCSAVQEETEKQVTESNSNSMKQLASRCQELIHERYSESDFSVAMIAEELQLSQSYLSRVFKQQMGVGLLEYIHRYRIVKARQILDEEAHLSLEDVAARTGFFNVGALIRVFKKIEGVTPGQYRDGLH